MSTLISVIEAVKEKSLNKTELESYRDDLANITALMLLEISDIEKEEALYPQIDENETESSRKRRWRMTEKGQRQIELKNYIRASKEILSSLRSRLFSIY